MPDADDATLPPTQHLVMEVLAARHRLGEPIWTFPTNCLPAARALQAQGRIWWKRGVVERTFQAAMTDYGRREWLCADYQPPVPAGTGPTEETNQ